MEHVYNRINALCEQLLTSLPPTYTRNIPDPKDKIAFALSRKHTKELPNPGGVRYWRCGAISLRALIALVSHHTNDTVVMQKMRRILVDGEDENVVVQGPQRSEAATDSIVNDEITKRVEIEVRKYIEQLAAKADQANAKPAQPAKTLTAKKQTPSKKDILAAVWVPRAAEMGEKVKLSNLDETLVDGRWLRFFQPRWEAFTKAKQDTATSQP